MAVGMGVVSDCRDRDYLVERQVFRALGHRGMLPAAAVFCTCGRQSACLPKSIGALCDFAASGSARPGELRGCSARGGVGVFCQLTGLMGAATWNWLAAVALAGWARITNAVQSVSPFCSITVCVAEVVGVAQAIGNHPAEPGLHMRRLYSTKVLLVVTGSLKVNA